MKKSVSRFLLCVVLAFACLTVAHADTSATAQLKAAAAAAPTTATLQQGDPGGTLTGTINDVPAADPKVGVTVADVANQVGQNKIGINFTWTLVCGFLVMFMQAGFAMVEAGLVPREECQSHLHDELHACMRADCSHTGSSGLRFKWAVLRATAISAACNLSTASTR